MTISYTDINWTATADAGKALCPSDEYGPTTITSVTAPLSVPTANWKDCDYDDGDGEQATESDKDSALRMLGVEI